MRVAVYTITKNESQFIGRWAESCVEDTVATLVPDGLGVPSEPPPAPDIEF